MARLSGSRMISAARRAASSGVSASNSIVHDTLNSVILVPWDPFVWRLLGVEIGEIF